MLEVYGTRMIVIFLPLRLGRYFVCQTQDLEKNGKLYRHLKIGIFTVLAKTRPYNIMVMHIKRMSVVKRRMRKSVSDSTYDKPLNRDDEQGPIFKVAEIAQLLKVREKEVHDGESESEDENEETGTLFQYCSEDEGGATAEVDSDDE
jgi:hypothetical protein